ncbi:Zn-ribbon domain-containing OB-fold protein [Streptomyces sp. NBC_01465]|uniref:Zn-ribbon domain-containing OB-fold protein n=1 Tax=Streptomyces sp. NBC_01465 TaxID=2903878 RepID=UPI002E311F4E|nr:zinc ribbon domain-containing protein [Streptomyces sp. NBC_01465]
MSSTGIDTAPAVQTETGLVFQRCRWCGTASFRRLLCPVCASSDLESERSDGHGVVVRSNVVHRHTGAARNESLIRFPEGFMFRCRVVGAAPHLVWVGARVRPVNDGASEAGEVVFELCETAGRVDWY